MEMKYRTIHTMVALVLLWRNIVMLILLLEAAGVFFNLQMLLLNAVHLPSFH